MKSPCVNECVYSHIDDYCTGCFRTLEEIKGWWKMIDSEKRKVLRQCELRKYEGAIRPDEGPDLKSGSD